MGSEYVLVREKVDSLDSPAEILSIDEMSCRLSLNLRAAQHEFGDQVELSHEQLVKVAGVILQTVTYYAPEELTNMIEEVLQHKLFKIHKPEQVVIE